MSGFSTSKLWSIPTATALSPSYSSKLPPFLTLGIQGKKKSGWVFGFIKDFFFWVLLSIGTVDPRRKHLAGNSYGILKIWEQLPYFSPSNRERQWVGEKTRKIKYCMAVLLWLFRTFLTSLRLHKHRQFSNLSRSRFKCQDTEVSPHSFLLNVLVFQGKVLNTIIQNGLLYLVPEVVFLPCCKHLRGATGI